MTVLGIVSNQAADYEVQKTVKRGVSLKRLDIRQVSVITVEIIEVTNVGQLLMQDVSDAIRKIICLVEMSVNERAFHDSEATMGRK